MGDSTGRETRSYERVGPCVAFEAPAAQRQRGSGERSQAVGCGMLWITSWTIWALQALA